MQSAHNHAKALPPWQGAAAPGAPRGDLIVELRVMEHARFQRHGDDLRCTVAVPLHQASLQATAALAKYGISKCCLHTDHVH